MEFLAEAFHAYPPSLGPDPPLQYILITMHNRIAPILERPGIAPGTKMLA